jgi:hypothetical protein
MMDIWAFTLLDFKTGMLDIFQIGSDILPNSFVAEVGM